MSTLLLETIQRIVREELARQRTAELAVIQEQHPHATDGDDDNYACTVVLRDTGLVLRRVPVATQAIGAASIPAVGELVLVAFVGGDLNAPVIVGRLYNDEDRPPVNGDGRSVLHLPLGAADDEAVHLEVHSGDRREVALTLGSGLALTLRDDDPVVELIVDGGKATLAIDRDGAVRLETSGDLSIEAGKVGIKGSEITVEASGTLDLKGATINLN